MLRIVLAAALLAAGCATTRPLATATRTRQTAEGGVVVLVPGDEPQAAARRALTMIEAHCGAVYEIVERSTVATGSASVFDDAVIAHTGTAFTYQCRAPRSNTLNVQLATFASQDLLGGPCNKDQDCGVYLCAPSTPRICTQRDGSVPFARLGEPCGPKPCVYPLTCYDWGSGAKCRKM